MAEPSRSTNSEWHAKRQQVTRAEVRANGRCKGHDSQGEFSLNCAPGFGTFDQSPCSSAWCFEASALWCAACVACMMRRLLMVTRVVVLCRLEVMVGRFFMVHGGGSVMLGAFVSFHVGPDWFGFSELSSDSVTGM